MEFMCFLCFAQSFVKSHYTIGTTIMEKLIAFKDHDTLNLNIVLVIFVVVLNAPLLKLLTSASVNHLPETPCLFTWCIIKIKQFIFFTHIFTLICMYIV